ncbi:MAG TPA: glutathione-disulfide reductase [Caulobacteraceae bacterium]
MAYDYDLFVIGAGSGGVRAARLAAMSGAKVAVAEEHRVGGTCVIRGCVPKKLMVYASEFSNTFKVAEQYGWSSSEPAKFDWKRFITTKDIEIARLSGVYVTNLQNAGADLVHARAVLKDAHTVEIVGKNRTVTAEKILIATGGRPVKPGVEGAEHAITSEEAFHLENLPKSILVVGGGYIAVEFAGIFAGMGSEVTLLYRGPNILRGFDEDVRVHLGTEMKRRGVRVVLGCEHIRIDKTDEGLVSHLTDGINLTTEQVMFATGREPHVKDLGLETAGVELNERGAIKVDEYSKTTADNIWAVGDVTDRINLTPVAIREGAAFADTVFRDTPTSFDHQDVATAVFSQPPIGTVGLTEAQARHQLGKVDIYRSVFRPMKTAFYGGDERCLMKLVVDAETDKVVGVHMVGPDAPEIVQMAAIAVKAGITKAQWDETCAVHPTAAEEFVTMREKYKPQDLGGVA